MRVKLKDPSVGRGLSMPASLWDRVDSLAIERGIPVSKLIQQMIARSLFEADIVTGRKS